MSDWAAARNFAVDAIDAGWSVLLRHGIDTGDNPFVNVEARRGHDHIVVTWHTRATGTYRLFSCMVNLRDVSLKSARAAVTS